MKRIIGILLTCLAILSLAACAGGSKPDNTAAPEVTASAVPSNVAQATYLHETEAASAPFIAQEPERQAFDPETDADNRYSCANITMIEADGGFYYSSASCYYLMYYDESLGELIPVCSKPECEHFKNSIDNQNRSCDAYLEASRHPSLYNGKLYYVCSPEGKLNPNTNGTRGGGALYRMDPDGTNKEFVKDAFAPGFDSPQWIMIHRGMIYAYSIESEVLNGEPINKIKILGLPIDGDETTFRVLYEYDGEAWGGMRFVGDRCYFWLGYSEGEYMEDEDGFVITDHLIPGAVIGYWDAVEEKLTILLDEHFPQGEIGYFDGGVWVTPDERIIVTVPNGLAELKNGELVEIVSYAEPDHEYYPVLSDGIVILREIKDRRYDPNDDPIWWVLDFEGTTIYKGPLPMDWDDAPDDYSGYAFNYIGGDKTGLYVDFCHYNYEGEAVKQRFSLVRYDIADGTLVPNKLSSLYATWY